MANRQQQADRVTAALAKWLTASVAFDEANQADIVAKEVSNAAFKAANDVAWKLAEHSGVTRQEKIAAEQLAITAEEKRKAYDDAFALTAAKSTARNDARAELLSAVDALDQTGEVENMGGTIL